MVTHEVNIHVSTPKSRSKILRAALKASSCLFPVTPCASQKATTLKQFHSAFIFTFWEDGCWSRCFFKSNFLCMLTAFKISLCFWLSAVLLL